MMGHKICFYEEIWIIISVTPSYLEHCQVHLLCQCMHLSKAELVQSSLGAKPLFYCILFYPITLEGHRGTTDEFATIPFHLDLFSAALVELAKSIPVHSLILSSRLFFCLPLFLFPFTVPCRIVFAKPEDLET